MLLCSAINGPFWFCRAPCMFPLVAKPLRIYSGNVAVMRWELAAVRLGARHCLWIRTVSKGQRTDCSRIGGWDLATSKSPPKIADHLAVRGNRADIQLGGSSIGSIDWLRLNGGVNLQKKSSKC